eukprot:3598608-Amphidinium_carterae.1
MSRTIDTSTVRGHQHATLKHKSTKRRDLPLCKVLRSYEPYDVALSHVSGGNPRTSHTICTRAAPQTCVGAP